MKMFLAGLAIVLFMFGIVGMANATLIFSDNFNTENGGVGKLNYANFANWNVLDGTVDLIGNGYYPLGQNPSYGLFVDMDGSTSNAGKMITRSFLNLDAGDYSLYFDLAGNQRNNATETVKVLVNMGVLSKNYSLSRFQNFSTFTESFSLSVPQSVTLSFEGVGGDNIGMLLDNVQLEKIDPVPEPTTMLLLGSGLVGLFGFRKKFKI